MYRKYFFPAVAFLVVFISVLLLGSSLNAMVPVFRSGDTIGADYRGSIATLDGFRQDGDGNYCADLKGRCETDDLTLIFISSAPDTIYVNGTKAVLDTYGSISGRLLVAQIPAEAFSYGKAGVWSIRLELHSASADSLSGLSLCSIDSAMTIVAVYNVLMPMIYGILLTISVYGFLLYLSKRDGTLLLFSLYTLCLFLWCFTPCLISHFGVKSSVLSFVHIYSFDFAVILGMVTCLSFCKLKMSGRRRWLDKWYGILALCLAFSLLENCLSARSGEVLLFLFYMAGCAVLVITCGKSDRKPWVALCGLSITQALRFIAIQYPHPSFYFDLMKLLRLLTLPYVIGCMIDINTSFARKFREAELLACELDKKVEERTKQLTEQQQIKTNLMTNIFHDLRTPLLIMRGCMDKLKNERRYDEEMVQILDERLAFITDMTEDLFATIKLEDKSLFMETEPVPLEPILRKIVDGCRIEADKKNIGIECRCKVKAVAWGDETWLSRAFQNLIANAVYYSKPDGGSVRVLMDTADGRILIEISDHGVGIAPEDKDKIFDRYYRVSGTKKHKSSGLGLSIAASVIAHHNGSIKVNSKVGEGTTFLVELPLWSIEQE